MAAARVVLDSVSVVPAGLETDARRVEQGGRRRRRGEGPEPGVPAPQRGLARFGDVPGLRSLRTIDDLEFDLLAFLERAESRALNRREVHEDVITALALDESVALRVVEPLDLAGDTHALAC